MTEREAFFEASYDKIVEAFQSIDSEERQDTYALSFWFYNEDDDMRYPVISVSFNTITHFKEQSGNVFNPTEAKWNYAYWLQEEVLEIGGSEDELLKAWLKTTPYYYSDEEDKEAEEDDLLFDEIIAKGKHLEKTFIDVMIDMINQLHNHDIIKKTFGRKLAVILHELEYYDKPIAWTKAVNEPYLIDEFLTAYNNDEL